MAYLYIKEQIQDKRNCTEIQFILADRSPWNAIKGCFHNVEMISGTSSFLIWGTAAVSQNPVVPMRSVRALELTWCQRCCLCLSVTQVCQPGWQMGAVSAAVPSHRGEGGQRRSQMLRWKGKVCLLIYLLLCQWSGTVSCCPKRLWSLLSWIYPNLNWTQPWALSWGSSNLQRCLPTSTLLWSMRTTLL